MTHAHRFLFLSLILAVFAAAGCASRPDEALKLAQQAMEQAKQVEALDFAPADWKSAQKAWDDAQIALKDQKYADAAGHLRTARSRFEKAATIAKAKREDVRKEVNMLQNAANKRIASLREEVDSTRISAKAKRDLSDGLREVEVAVEKVNTAVLNEQLVLARTSGQSALEKLNEVEKKVAAVSKRPMY